MEHSTDSIFFLIQVIVNKGNRTGNLQFLPQLTYTDKRRKLKFSRYSSIMNRN